MKRLLKYLGWGALTIVGLVLLFYGLLRFINRHDQPASADYIAMQRLAAERPQIPDADNGYLYLQGFEAPQDADPAQLGARRTAWLEAFNHDTSLKRADPQTDTIDFETGRSQALTQHLDHCKPIPKAECGAALAGAAPALALEWSELDRLQVERYRKLIAHPRWREVLWLDTQAPMPSYGPVIEGQRLLFLTLAAQAPKLDALALRAALQADIRFWRQVSTSSDMLITRMVAAAALRNHFYFANHVLRGSPVAAILDAVPEEWSAPLTREELSMRRALAGELAFQDALLRKSSAEMSSWMGSDETFAQRWLGRLTVPLFQPQDTMNRTASEYVALVAQLDVPLDRYLAAMQLEPRHERPASRLYNPVMNYLMPDHASLYPPYALRTASIEGMRRAALLTVQLRARGVAETDVPRELATAGMRNPFTGAPFTWDPEAHAVIYEGPEDHNWKRQAYRY